MKPIKFRTKDEVLEYWSIIMSSRILRSLIGGSDGPASEWLDGDPGSECGVEVSGFDWWTSVHREHATEREPVQRRGTAWSLHSTATSRLQIPTDGLEPGGDGHSQSHVSGQFRCVYVHILTFKGIIIMMNDDIKIWSNIYQDTLSHPS